MSAAQFSRARGALVVIATLAVQASAMAPARATAQATVLAIAPATARAAIPQSAAPAAVAVDIAAGLARGDLSRFRASATRELDAALDDAQLRSLFAELSRSGGAFRGTGAPREQRQGEFVLQIVPLEYAQATHDLRLVFDAAGRVAGLQLRPAETPVAYSTAPYADPKSFTAEETVVDAGGWPLPATLLLPRGAGPCPALVLVHGSGPGDRDSSFGPNRIFRDLAEGLASRGIAVLRYEKRTREHAARTTSNPDFTPREEVIDDALAAVALLRRDARVDASRVFVAGHSFGGMLAPQIAAADPAIAGLVVLAGAVRPLEDSIVSQAQYLARLDGSVSATERRQLQDLERLARRVRALRSPSDPPIDQPPFGAPAGYLLALRGYDPPALAARLPQPILVLQGERDYQVTMADFAAWRAALGGEPRAVLRSYPALNHFFLAGSGPSAPPEYAVPGHVAEEVVRDIAAWIHASEK